VVAFAVSSVVVCVVVLVAALGYLLDRTG